MARTTKKTASTKSSTTKNKSSKVVTRHIEYTNSVPGIQKRTYFCDWSSNKKTLLTFSSTLHDNDHNYVKDFANITGVVSILKVNWNMSVAQFPMAHDWYLFDRELFVDFLLEIGKISNNKKIHVLINTSFKRMIDL